MRERALGLCALLVARASRARDLLGGALRRGEGELGLGATTARLCLLPLEAGQLDRDIGEEALERESPVVDVPGVARERVHRLEVRLELGVPSFESGCGVQKYRIHEWIIPAVPCSVRHKGHA